MSSSPTEHPETASQADGPASGSAASNPLKTVIMGLVYVLVLATFLYAVQRAGGWRQLLAPWRVMPLQWLALACVGQLAAYALRALRIYKAEPAIPRDRFGGCLRLIAINTAANWLLPMRSGEASFPILMRRWFGIELTHATGVLVWLRLLDLHVLATIGLICLRTGVLSTATSNVAQTLSSLALFGLGAAVCAPLLLFALRAPLSAYLATTLPTQPATSASWRAKPIKLLNKMLSGVPSRPIALAGDLLLCWNAWVVKLASLGLLLATLAGLPPTLGILGAIGGDLSTVLPLHTPGGFGTYEAGVVAALSASSAPLANLLQAAVNLHLFVLGLALLAGAAALLVGLRSDGATERAAANLLKSRND